MAPVYDKHGDVMPLYVEHKAEVRAQALAGDVAETKIPVPVTTTGFLTLGCGVHTADEDALLTLHGPHVTQSVRLTYVLMLATAAGTNPRWTHLHRTVGTHRGLQRLTNLFLHHQHPRLLPYSLFLKTSLIHHGTAPTTRVITAAP
jgi:hypothetical protein